MTEVCGEIGLVRKAMNKWDKRWEKELIDVKRQFETDKKEQEGKLELLVAHQEQTSSCLGNKL